MNTSSATLDKITSLCKRRGFVYPTADLYGGLNGLYDFGHLGVLMKNNIKQLWQQSLQATGHKILLFDGAQLGPEIIWQASGHVKNFHDPMVDCLSCKHRYRADELDLKKPCPHCGNNTWTAVREFQLMFQTQVGALASAHNIAYLRPETAQTIFANFKNIYSSNRVKIPFGVAQVGKAFRNEITPKQFLFRMREFEQMELEFFCEPNEAASFFDFWCDARQQFYQSIGIQTDRTRFYNHQKKDLAHYAIRGTDVEYEFPFGWKEVEGIANRGAYDLSQHMSFANKDLHVFDEKTQTNFIPHVVECSVGVDRLFLTLLFDAYHEDIIENEPRVVLKLNPRVAPITAAILPLVKKLTEQTLRLYKDLARTYGAHIEFDDTGSIGKRYRRYDEIGTPVCFTYDFESEASLSVTARNRDNLTQERISIDSISRFLDDLIKTT